MTKGGESFAMERILRTQGAREESVFAKKGARKQLENGCRRAPYRANFNTQVFASDRRKRRTPNSQTVRGSELGLWRKGWDSNPRYGITVYRISSPAHSTSLPPFRVRGEFEYYSMNLKKARVDEKNSSFCLFGAAGEAKSEKRRAETAFGMLKMVKGEARMLRPLLPTGCVGHPAFNCSTITSLPGGELQGRPCRDGALRGPSRSRRRSDSFRAPRRACGPRRGPSRSGCGRNACGLLRP